MDFRNDCNKEYRNDLAYMYVYTGRYKKIWHGTLQGQGDVRRECNWFEFKPFKIKQFIKEADRILSFLFVCLKYLWYKNLWIKIFAEFWKGISNFKVFPQTSNSYV